MNVVFLDINGVLDTHENMDVIDHGNLSRLKQLIDMFDAKVVISSSLKNTFYLTGHYSKLLQGIIDTLLESGIDVVGITPQGSNREEEIPLPENSQIVNMVTGRCDAFISGCKAPWDIYAGESMLIEQGCNILDDDYDMDSLREHLVKLPMQMNEGQNGFTQEYLDKAVGILGR